MLWSEIRAIYPNQWLLVEAIKAHTAGNQRILDQLAVIETFPDAAVAWQTYRQHHREAPTRELFVLHTNRETLDIKVIYRGGFKIPA
jgi:hypothetical protein